VKGLGNVLSAKLECAIPGEVFDVSFGTGNQVVKADHRAAFSQKAIAKMRPDESGSARYNGTFHSAVLT
jgi:hypothetical protein